MTGSTNEQLVQQYIDVPDGRGPDRAYLRDYGVEVWALIMYYQHAAQSDVDVVARDYHLPRAAVEAALAYFNCHRDAIQARIAVNLAYVT